MSAQLWQIPETMMQKRGNDAFMLFTGDEEGLASGLVILVVEKAELRMVALISPHLNIKKSENKFTI